MPLGSRVMYRLLVAGDQIAALSMSLKHQTDNNDDKMTVRLKYCFY
ncbi:MAG: hypothetical protein ABFS56_21400 [Pseudomonadota bacterium]